MTRYRKETSPFQRGEDGRLRVVWRNFLLLDNWRMPWRDFLLIVIVLGMTVSYVHDTRICREIADDPCGWMELNELACYEPGSCVARGQFGVVDGGLINVSFNMT